MFKDYITSKISNNEEQYTWLRYLDHVQELFRDPWTAFKIIFVMQIVVPPTGTLTYIIAASTDCGFVPYFLGCTGQVFKVALHTFIGSSLYQVTLSPKEGGDDWLLTVELIASVLLSVGFTVYTKRYLDRMIKESTAAEKNKYVEMV